MVICDWYKDNGLTFMSVYDYRCFFFFSLLLSFLAGYHHWYNMCHYAPWCSSGFHLGTILVWLEKVEVLEPNPLANLACWSPDGSVVCVIGFVNWVRCGENKHKINCILYARACTHTTNLWSRLLLATSISHIHMFSVPILVQNLLIFTKNQPRFFPKLSMHETQHFL